MKVRSAEEASRNYRDSIARVPARYSAGIAGTTNWQDEAIKAEELYAQKVQEAISERSRAKGLEQVSDEAWRKAAQAKGAARIGPGMTAGVDAQRTNWAPFRSALEALDLEARTADPMQNIDNRVKAVVAKLVETKKAQLG